MRSKGSFLGAKPISDIPETTVLGWYGRANAGDDAFVDALPLFIDKPALNFVAPRDPKFQPEQHSLIVVGAGDVCKPYFLDEVRGHEKVIVIGAGLGFESEVNFLKEVNPKFLWMRNRRDVEICNSVGLKAFYTPDLCFGLPKIDVPKSIDYKDSRKRLGVILSGHALSGVDQLKMGEAGYLEYMQWELAESLSYLEEFYQIHWISMSADPDAWDESIHYSVRKKMKKRENQEFHPYKSYGSLRVRELIASMDLVVSMKFHGCVFAIHSEVPVISIALSRKNQLLMQEAGLSELLVEPFSFQKERFIDHVKVAEDPNVIEKIRAVSKGYVDLYNKAKHECAILFAANNY